MIAGDRRSQAIAGDRKSGHFHTFANDQRADRSHKFWFTEMSNTHAQSKMCRMSEVEIEEGLLLLAN